MRSLIPRQPDPKHVHQQIVVGNEFSNAVAGDMPLCVEAVRDFWLFGRAGREVVNQRAPLSPMFLNIAASNEWHVFLAFQNMP